MQVTVRLFGSIREALGAKDLQMTVPEGADLACLRELLAREHPAFREHSSRLRAAVNLEMADDHHRLTDADEVAFLPPVSGGVDASAMDRGSGSRCELTDHPLDPAAVMARVAGPDAGGVVSFVGAVRNSSKGHSIRHLEYEAYPGMAEAEMQKIADEAAVRWPGSRVAIAHRTGHLAVGDLAVVVVAAAPHRAEAFEAARFAIDTLKERVPIWKKEVATDGEYWVEDHP